MSNIIDINGFNKIPPVFIKNNKVFANSRNVAEYFNKDHFHVLRDIKNMECSPEFNASNFGCVEYTDAKGEKRLSYDMTSSGGLLYGLPTYTQLPDGKFVRNPPSLFVYDADGVKRVDKSRVLKIYEEDV